MYYPICKCRLCDISRHFVLDVSNTVSVYITLYSLARRQKESQQALLLPGASRVASGHLRPHAVARTPAGLIGLVCSYCPTNSGLPSITSGSAPASLVSGLAQRSPTVVTACMLAKSPNVTLYTGGSDGFVTSTAAPIATGCSVSKPVPGWDFHPRLTG